MKTNMLFDEAWHELHDARRAENINEVIAAAARLQRAARMMKLEKQQQAEEDQVLPLGQKPVGPTHREHTKQMECGVHDYRNVPGTHQIKCTKCGLRA